MTGMGSSRPKSINGLPGIIGIGFNLRPKKILSFQMEANIERIGFTDEYFGKKFFLNNDYLTIPLIAQLEFGNNFQIFINTGFYAGFCYFRSDNYFGGTVTKKFLKMDSDDLFDYGFLSSVGFEVPVKSNLNIHMQARYTSSLASVSSFQLWNRSLAFFTGIKYRLNYK
jgi:hypothetical protein